MAQDDDMNGKGTNGRSDVPGAAPDPRHDLAGALHDVSNALTVLLGWVAEARLPGASSDAVAYALRIIEQRGRAARDLARRAIGVEIPRTDDFELVDVTLSDTIDGLTVEAQHLHVSLELATPPTGARITGASELAQIVTNLLLNAMAHSPSGGTVRVRSFVAPRGLQIDVEDDGPGISEERVLTLFDGVSTRTGGAGVGLRHARALARANGGELLLAKKSPADPARGACFRIFWPQDGHLAAVPPSTARPRTLEGVRILVLEDDDDVCTLLEASLGARGAQVTVARNASDLARAIDRREHDAALLDLSPISRDVEGALAAFRARSPHASVVFITGSVDRLPEHLAGQIHCVRKPFEVSEVVEALSRRKHA
ncbi:ATP-binding protein [Pendulispora rubella]|uniref:histidine kinase n=1 Tax=Pendulispora rubella TaxID=2741070 RepID=A0ABZ2LJE4_9BACT